MNVNTTKDYNKFKYIKGNREILPYHVNALMNSISENNMLPYNPIIVNSKMEVIDGQHRLEAAKRLGFPIFYMESPIGTISDVAHLNSVVRRWTTSDYVDSYAKQGFKDYLVLKDFCEKTSLSPTIASALLYAKAVKPQTSKVSSVRKIVAAGEFKVNYLDWALDLANKIQQIKPFTEGVIGKSREFIHSLVVFYKQVDHEQLMEKLREYPDKLYSRGTVLGYIRQFEDVINYKVKNKRVLSFKANDTDPGVASYR